MKFAEDVRFSDPMSHESLFELEKQIRNALITPRIVLQPVTMKVRLLVVTLPRTFLQSETSKQRYLSIK